MLCQPDSGEMALEVVDQLVRSNAIDLIAVDSVAALVPRAEIEGEIGAVQGAAARPVAGVCPRALWQPVAARWNHVMDYRDSICVLFERFSIMLEPQNLGHDSSRLLVSCRHDPLASVKTSCF